VRSCVAVQELLGPEVQVALDELLVTVNADDSQDAESEETRRSVLSELKG
jgi:hypothetical protein